MLHRLIAIPALTLSLMLSAAAPAVAQEQPSAEARAWISPDQGATRTVIRLFAEGLPGMNEVTILGGPSPDQLLPIAAAETDREGALGIQLKVPADADRGDAYYFAVDPAGDVGPVVAEPPFQVIVRTNPAPGGA